MDINILWQKTDKIALGLSGGVDSIALFHLLVTKYKESYKELVAFHINHGLREQSYEEAEFVENFVKNYNVKFYKKDLNMKDLVRDSHTSEEMLARKLRYEAFEEMSSLEGGVKLITAHHKNDQVENILMRLFSGRSMDYNLMIEEKTTIGELAVYRPLLNVLKIDLEQYADKNDLKYYVDSTNFDTDYTRNNIRHNIVPLLNDVNAASFDNLINFSSYYQNINTELKNKVLEAKNDYVILLEEDKVELDKEKLNKQNKYLDNYGLEVVEIEEGFMLTEKKNFYYNIFKNYVSDDYRDFIKLCSEDIDYIDYFSSLEEHPEIIADKVINWEKFLEKYPDSKLKKKANNICYSYRGDYIIALTSLPTTEALKNGKINEDVKELNRFIKKYPNSPTSDIIKYYLENYKEEDISTLISKKLDKGFKGE